MTEEQEQLMKQVMQAALEQFFWVGYPEVFEIIAGHQSAMLFAWGLEENPAAIARCAELQTELSECVTIVEVSSSQGLQA